MLSASGVHDGDAVGKLDVGNTVGIFVGVALGLDDVGVNDGNDVEGDFDGEIVGDVVGMAEVGFWEGIFDGDDVGAVVG